MLCELIQRRKEATAMEKFLSEIKGERTLPNSFCEASAILILSVDRKKKTSIGRKRKVLANRSHEYGYKNPQENISQKTQPCRKIIIYIPCPNEVYLRNERLV